MKNNPVTLAEFAFYLSSFRSLFVHIYIYKTSFGVSLTKKKVEARRRKEVRNQIKQQIFNILN